MHLELHQAGPREIVPILRAGQVDIGIATEALVKATVRDALFPRPEA